MTGKEKSKFRSTSKWKDFRKIILKERNYTCELCSIKKTSGLNLHHLEPENYTDINKEKFVILCRYCHREIERCLIRKEFNLIDYLINFQNIFSKSKPTEPIKKQTKKKPPILARHQTYTMKYKNKYQWGNN